MGPYWAEDKPAQATQGRAGTRSLLPGSPPRPHLVSHKSLRGGQPSREPASRCLPHLHPPHPPPRPHCSLQTPCCAEPLPTCPLSALAEPHPGTPQTCRWNLPRLLFVSTFVFSCLYVLNGTPVHITELVLLDSRPSRDGSILDSPAPLPFIYFTCSLPCFQSYSENPTLTSPQPTPSTGMTPSVPPPPHTPAGSTACIPPPPLRGSVSWREQVHVCAQAKEEHFIWVLLLLYFLY